MISRVFTFSPGQLKKSLLYFLLLEVINSGEVRFVLNLRENSLLLEYSEEKNFYIVIKTSSIVIIAPNLGFPFF